MKPEDILKLKPTILKQEQREFYFENGYLLLESIVPQKWLELLRSTTNNKINESKNLSESNDIFDLDKGHSFENPRLRRLSSPNDHDDNYWKYASEFLPNIISDLVGPNVKFHHSKLNFKWFDDSDKVNWHQDIQFFPHTNYNVFTIGCYLEDTDMDNGPLGVLPASHEGKLYNQYDSAGNWKGALSKEDVKNIDLSKVQYLMGAAGSITIHNCRTLHSSPPSKSQNPRPLLLNCYSSADAKAYTPHPDKSKNAYRVVRGRQSLWAKHDPRPCLIPPDWSGGYTSIYAAQSGEDK